MAFDLLDRPQLFIPVRWPGLRLGEDGEAVPTENEVDIQVTVLDNEALRDWGKLSLEDDDGAKVASFRTVASGWRKIVANGKPVPFTDDNIVRLLKTSGFSEAFARAYIDAWQGRVATREGNSAGSPGNGQMDEPIAATPKART